MIDLADVALERWLATLTGDMPVHVGEPDPAAGTTPAVSLVLLSIGERTDRRDDQVVDVRDADGRVVARHRAARFFELDYLCCVGGEHPLRHHTTGAILQGLVDTDTIPNEHLPDELRQHHALLEVDVVPDRLPMEVVQAFGASVGGSLVIRVVLPVAPSPERDIAPPATDLHLDVSPPPGRSVAATEPTNAERTDATDAPAMPALAERKWTTVRRRELIAGAVAEGD